MQNTLMNLLGSEHILVNVDALDAKEAIHKMTVALIATGHVAPGFAEDVWKREQTFPTGLPTQPLAVAIPHADPDHVNRSAVCIGVLNSPVRFAQMGTDGSTFLDVHLVFMLAIKEREKQVEMIQQLMTVIQNVSLLDGLSKAKDSADAFRLIQSTLAGKGHDGKN
jgi:PTS system galactitol-specific IIA component